MTTHGPLIHADGTSTFRVWAPRARTVSLVRGGERAPMEPLDLGWFQAVGEGRHGDHYAFQLDRGSPRPDPASRWQPDGVHGVSGLLDPTTFDWPDQEAQWQPPRLADAVIYELHVGTFTPERTLDAAAGRLGRLAELGVTHVELMPVNAFNGVHGWGYDGVAWFAVHQPYGGPAALARFVRAAHAEGLAVVLDVVYNHLGPSGNYLPDFGPYLTDRYRTPWGDGLNLDGPDSDPVRAFVIQNALQWLTDFHVDALRLDAVHGLVDTSAVHLLTELSQAVETRATALGRPLTLIAESDRNDPATITARSLGGQGMDGQWADDLHHGIHTAVTAEHDGYYVDYLGLPDVAAAYARGFVYDGRYSRYRRRRVGAPFGDLPGARLVTCIQNHDQVGNRALGERLTTLVEPSLVRIAILLLCAAPTTPLLFMGEEYGETAPFQYFASHPEPELADAVRQGRRKEFAAFASFAGTEVPDPQDPATLERSTLDPDRQTTAEAVQRSALWSDLLRLRQTHPAIGNGRLDLVEVLDATAEVMTLTRRDRRAAPVLVTVNLAPAERTLPAPPGSWSLLMWTESARFGGRGGPEPRLLDDGSIRLPARTAALWDRVESAGPERERG